MHAWLPEPYQDSTQLKAPISKQSFPRTARLLAAAEFTRVFKDPVKSTDRSFLVLARANTISEARLGLAIAKKQVKTATGRNRIKRVIRDSFRRHRMQLQGLDIVVLARKGTAGQSNGKLFASLEAHWMQLAKTK